MVPDVKFGEDVTNAVKEYYQLVGATSRAPILDEVGRRIVLDGRRGLTGAGFDNLRALLSATPADAQLATVLGKIRTALDDAMERSIALNNPAHAPAWRQARTQERNLRVIEKAIAGRKAAGEGTVTLYRVDDAAFPPRVATDGSIPIVTTRSGGERALFVNIGQPERAAEFALVNRRGNATVTAVEVDASILQKLRDTAVFDRSAAAALHPTAPLRVDISKAPDQFGLRTPEHIQMLRDAIIPGTVRTVDPRTLGR
jgi:hypothetical protein